MSKFTARDFSIVVQGPIHSSPENKGSRDITVRCLASIRRFFPGAELVLSTWNGAATDGLDCDVLVKSEDPGAVAFTDAQPPTGFNNTNRQIVSTRAGMEAASREFAVKFRGDFYFESACLLELGESLSCPLRGAAFRSRIHLGPYLTGNPRRHRPAPFFFSDLLQAGRLEDLRKLWNIPLAPEPETTRWLETHAGSSFFPVHEGVKLRLFPEQYIIVAFLATQNRHFRLDHPYDISPRKLLASEKFLLESFRVIEVAQFGVKLPARLSRHETEDHFYHATDWERLSAQYRFAPTRWMAQASLLVRPFLNLAAGGFRWLFLRKLPRLFAARARA